MNTTMPLSLYFSMSAFLFQIFCAPPYDKDKEKNIHSLLIYNINHKLIYPDLEYDYKHLGYQEAMDSSGSLQNQLTKHI